MAIRRQVRCVHNFAFLSPQFIYYFSLSNAYLHLLRGGQNSAEQVQREKKTVSIGREQIRRKMMCIPNTNQIITMSVVGTNTFIHQLHFG